MIRLLQQENIGTKLSYLFVLIVLTISIFSMINEVYGYSYVGVTDNGVEFPIESSEPLTLEDGSSVTIESMINGMGIQSRIIQEEYDGYIVHGTGNIGQDSSIIPYISVSSTTDFTSLIEDTDKVESYVIPQFWNEYKLENDSLTNISDTSNVLGYDSSVTHTGTLNISTSGDGIIISGNGKGVIKLLDYSNQKLVLRGETNTGSIKIITSDIDLINEVYTSGNGYLVYSGGSASPNVVVGLDSTHYATASWTSGYTYRSQSCGCGSNGAGGCAYYYVNTSYTPYSGSSTVSVTIAESDMIDHKKITNLSGYSATAPASTGNSSWSWCQKYLNNGVQNGWVSGVTLKVYDTLPGYTKLDYTGDFVEDYTFSTDTVYLYVSPNSDVMTIKGESISNLPFIKITNVTSNIPYQIIKDGLPIVTGMTSNTGEILVEELDNNSSMVDGILYLYPDSLSYRGSFSTVIFDNTHKEILHINTVEDTVYTAHAYVNIPVTGSVEIENLSIHGDFIENYDLDYLNGNYTSGDEIQVPIIPKFNSVSMDINTVATELDFANVLGGTGIKIANADSSTIKKSDWNNRINSMESIVGTTAYVIATTEGTINAIMTESISGSVTITNTYTLEQVPPPPPIPVRKDPLSGWVDVYVNGEKRGDSILLGVNPYPDFIPSSSSSGTSASQSVTYSYPDYVVSGNITIDVESGDFVEFYLYAKIHGDIEGYSAPSGYRIVSESGSGVATVNIKSASIQTS